MKSASPLCRSFKTTYVPHNEKIMPNSNYFGGTFHKTKKSNYDSLGGD